MLISFSPIRSDEARDVSVNGDVLTINGEAFDFSDLPDGATLPRDAVASDWLASDVERIDGQIALTLILPHTADASEAVRFPQPVDISAGAVIVEDQADE